MAPLSASGAIVFQTGPGNITGDENVQFNGKDLTLTGPLIEGQLNQSGQLVNFSGAGESLEGKGGQASLAAADGTLRNLSISLDAPGATFTSLILNLDVAGKFDGSVTFTVGQVGGADVVFSNKFLDAK